LRRRDAARQRSGAGRALRCHGRRAAHRRLEVLSSLGQASGLTCRAASRMLLVLTGATMACAGKAAVAAPRLTGEHACPGLSGFTCSTLRVPLGPSATLGLQVAAADNVRARRGVLLFLTGGPGEPCVPFVSRITRALGSVLGDYRL